LVNKRLIPFVLYFAQPFFSPYPPLNFLLGLVVNPTFDERAIPELLHELHEVGYKFLLVIDIPRFFCVTSNQVIINQRQEALAKDILSLLDDQFVAAADLSEITLSEKFFAALLFQISLAE